MDKAKELLVLRCAKREVLHNKWRQDGSVARMYLKVPSESLSSRTVAIKYCPKGGNDCFEPDSLFEMIVNVTGKKMSVQLEV